ncbi:sodium-dependent lysophosphatidylcholine symporter 1 isoform X2 [Callorhinchus milii]|uniref:sodium-dependent lysophosphatidylcholine symporter 1 isoform X2 n=1 Tax=Callorhinchus milii TaxID=7868 RepID=UPI001C3FA8B3|nr:sodium-dependent lysophosphatidylcholine symporter 1 isoform X2 [Callorhinchus milii]
MGFAGRDLLREKEEEEEDSGDSVLVRQKQKAESLSVCRKLCFAMGGAPYQMTGNAIGFFLQIFLLDVVQMEAFYASLILFTGRVWDAFTDPIVGFLVSKSRRTRFGKLLPWIIFSMPCGVAAYFLLWFSPSYTMSSAYSFIWYLVTYCAFHTCMSCFHVPYSALTMFLGGDQKDRDSATAFRMGVEIVATLAGAAIQGQIVGVYHAQTAESCRLSQNQSINSTWLLGNSLDSTKRAYILAAAVIGGLYFICSMILFLGVKELAGSLASKNQVAVSYLTGLKLVMNHKPYVSLTFGFLFISLAFQLVQGNFALFCTHAAGLGHHFQHIVLIILVSAALTVPFWQWVLMKFGKKTALFVGLIWYIPPLITIALVNRNLSLITVMAVPAGASLAVAFLLPWSMLPDVVDDFRAKHPHCLDLEALFYSFYVFFTKFAAGASLGFSTLCLHFSGYRAGTCSHSPTVAITLRVLIAPIPITLLLIGLVIFYFYPINETRRKQLKVELEAVMRDWESELEEIHTL